jgi:hypothetical protein
VKPCHKLVVDLTGAPAAVERSSLVDDGAAFQEELQVGVTQKTEVRIPEHLALQNMVIEVTGEGKQLFKTYYAT